ncbi:serine hydrolase domain-containing protein [Devosia sp. YIM 151766]|uniref:serine hydrolase domain-containing protein n=1 Tax=Devosia sp. YIM 151766 TaxID=3017325 RepID=UPI00255CFBB4|nr:serine hydrolase domain-containing protein [Devosia sp. YIM 151766]WIY53950.1 serine hydrolase domain-containing protein [Devosia sp. YIM 151766]
MRKRLIGTTLGALIATTGSATIANDQLDTVLQEVRNQHRLPAAGYVIVTSEGMVASGADGERARGTGTAVTPDDRWHIGSLTKAMTATLAVKLATDGLIELRTTVGDVLGSDYPAMNPAYRGVTLGQLLRHRGGMLSNLLDLNVWAGLRSADLDTAAHRKNLVNAILSYPAQAAPGGRYIYSNAGYVVAGAMLEAVAGDSWENLMAQHVFAPLSMHDTGFGAPGMAGAMDNALGHSLAGGSFRSVDVSVNADNPAAMGPAGTLHATLGDLSQFMAANLGGEPAYLAAEELALLHTPQAGEDYALGWQVGPHPCAPSRKVLMHTGSNTMWFATVWLDRAVDLGVVVTTNVGDPPGRRAMDDLGAKLWAALDRCR